MASSEPTASDQLNSRLFDLERRHMICCPGRVCCNRGRGCRQCGLEASDYPAFSLEGLLAEMEEIPPHTEVLKAGIYGSWPEYPVVGRALILVEVLRRGIRRLQVESRPEHVQEDWLKELRRALPSVAVEVEVGLDHWSWWAREHVLARKETEQHYRRAIELINATGLVSVTFVAFGLPFWTEKEAVEGAVSTASHAMAAGSQIIWLEPLVEQPGTLQAFLAERGLWQPIWSWSIVSLIKEVWKEAKNRGVQIRIGGLVQVPLPNPDTLPRNRHTCDDDGRFRVAFDQFSLAQDFRILKALRCSCRREYRAFLKKQKLFLREEVTALLAEFDRTRHCPA